MRLFGALHDRMSPRARQEHLQLSHAMFLKLLRTPLSGPDGDRFALRDIPLDDRLSELRFNYSFRRSVRVSQVKSLLAGYAKEVFGIGPEKITLRDDAVISGGFLNGAIDLMFRRNGKLYIADWKSNRINGREDGFTRTGLSAEMARNTYYFQYLIYIVAALKYLSLSLKHPVEQDDYERLFGGVFYFFLRGVDPARPGQGVFAERPAFDLIRKLDQMIG